MAIRTLFAYSVHGHKLGTVSMAPWGSESREGLESVQTTSVKVNSGVTNAQNVLETEERVGQQTRSTLRKQRKGRERARTSRGCAPGRTHSPHSILGISVALRIICETPLQVSRIM